MSPLLSMLWAKQRIAVHTLASVRRESRLKIAFVALSALALCWGIYRLSRFVFGLFEAFGSELLAGGQLSLGDVVMAKLLSVFALSVFTLLIVSNVLVAYATLYRSREMVLLVHSPLTAPTLFLGRFYECVVFSSWATAFLGAPVLIAYGIESSAPWIFYAALLPFYLPFVITPAAIGSILAMAGILVLSRMRQRGGVVMVVAVAAIGGLFVWFRGRLALPDISDASGFLTLLELLGRSQQPLLPSQWLANGLLAAATGDVAEAGFSFLLLLSTALFAVWLAVVAADRWLLDGWSARLAGGSKRGAKRRLFDVVERALGWLPEPRRSLIAKDLRLFWRDPTQWSQFLILFGILALYLASSDPGQAAGGIDRRTWQAWGTLLNLGAAMLILASLTTRFIYPLISLEGRRLWILSMAPLRLRSVVWQKLWLSVATTSVFTVGLALLSAFRLDLDPAARWLSLAAVVAATFALSGLAVGLGSLYPSLDDDNPSRIVSGLGGTLTFLLSMLYIALVIGALSLVMLGHVVEPVLGAAGYASARLAAFGGILVLTLVTWLLPMALGVRHLERLEL